MKVKQLIVFLQSLDQEADLLFADYFYEDREGFSITEPSLSGSIVRPEHSKYNKHYEGNVYLVDLSYFP